MKASFARRLAVLSSAAGLVLSVLPITPAEAQWVFIARKAAQRVHHMMDQGQSGQPGYDVASVILEAPADKVFAVALDHARNNKALRMLMVDPAGMRFQVAEGDRTATLNVIELNNEVSQLMIAGTAGRGEDPTSSRVVAAIMRVCAEMKKSCSVAR